MMHPRQAYRAVPIAFLLACAFAQAQERGANQVLLAPGKSVTFVDPANPGLQVLITAPADKPLDLSGLIAATEKGGTFSAVIGSQIRAAGHVVMNPDGSISLRESAPALSIAPAAAPLSSKSVTIEGGIVVMNPGNTVIHTGLIVNPVGGPAGTGVPATASLAPPVQQVPASRTPGIVSTQPLPVSVAAGGLPVNINATLPTSMTVSSVPANTSFEIGKSSTVPMPSLPAVAATAIVNQMTLPGGGTITGQFTLGSGGVILVGSGGSISVSGNVTAPLNVVTMPANVPTTGLTAGAITTGGAVQVGGAATLSTTGIKPPVVSITK